MTHSSALTGLGCIAVLTWAWSFNLTEFRVQGVRKSRLVGALGFEPRSAGVFRLACTRYAHALGLRQVGAPVGHQIHQKPTRRHSRATGARGTTRLYYTPVGVQRPRALLL